MRTITATDLKDETVIAELNNSIAKKKIVRLKIFQNDSLIISLNPSEMETRVNDNGYFSVTVYHPYLHIMLFEDEFSKIEIIEVE